MSTIQFDGLDSLQRELEKLAQSASELNGEMEVPFSELFSQSFMLEYTDFSSIDALLEAGGFHAETDEEFEAIPESELDVHIAKVTRFGSWEEMLGEATEQYFIGRLGF